MGDKFIILASDGLWGVVDNITAIHIVANYWELNDLEGAINALMKEAVRRWKQTDVYMDDISIFVGFLGYV